MHPLSQSENLSGIAKVLFEHDGETAKNHTETLLHLYGAGHPTPLWSTAPGAPTDLLATIRNNNRSLLRENHMAVARLLGITPVNMFEAGQPNGRMLRHLPEAWIATSLLGHELALHQLATDPPNWFTSHDNPAERPVDGAIAYQCKVLLGAARQQYATGGSARSRVHRLMEGLRQFSYADNYQPLVLHCASAAELTGHTSRSAAHTRESLAHHRAHLAEEVMHCVPGAVATVLDLADTDSLGAQDPQAVEQAAWLLLTESTSACCLKTEDAQLPINEKLAVLESVANEAFEMHAFGQALEAPHQGLQPKNLL